MFDVSSLIDKVMVIRRVSIRVYFLQALLQFGIVLSSDLYLSEKLWCKAFSIPNF